MGGYFQLSIWWTAKNSDKYNGASPEILGESNMHCIQISYQVRRQFQECSDSIHVRVPMEGTPKSLVSLFNFAAHMNGCHSILSMRTF